METFRQRPSSARRNTTATSPIDQSDDSRSPCFRNTERVSGRKRRQQHGGQHLASPQVGFSPHIDVRPHQKRLQRQHPRSALGVHQLDPRVERDQRGGDRGRMHDRAPIVAEYRMILIFTGEGETMLAALARAMMRRRTEIPAARPLQQIAAQRRDMAKLRAGRTRRRVGERGVTLGRSAGCTASCSNVTSAPIRVPASSSRDRVETCHVAQIDHPRGPQQSFLHQIEQIDPARLQHHAVGSGGASAVLSPASPPRRCISRATRLPRPNGRSARRNGPWLNSSAAGGRGRRALSPASSAIRGSGRRSR